MEGSLSRAPSFSESSQRLLSYLSSTSMNAMSNSSTSLQLLQEEPPLKRIKLETPTRSLDDLAEASRTNEDAQNSAKMESADSPRTGAITPPKPEEPEMKGSDEKVSDDPSKQGVVSPEHNPAAGSLAAAASNLPAPPPLPPPLKATTMSHLQKKYSQELEYMLREFQKLERQLLGAKGPSEESSGSRERREKLHSFIQHLEDTIRQIDSGCQLELEGKSTIATDEVNEGLAEAAALTHLTREKEEEENVQKLEEHILANLLPVKVRLKKQLAAQQGAKHNPAGMPHNHGAIIPAEKQGKGTFAEAADQWRKQAAEAQTRPGDESLAEPVDPAQTQFGKPLAGGGSSLTQKLHGQTLGSRARKHGHGVGSGKDKLEKPKQTYFAGMAGTTDQIKSSVSAASSVHKLLIKNPARLEMQLTKARAAANDTDLTAQPDQVESHMDADADSAGLSHEQKHKLRRKRKRKKKLRQEARARELKRQQKSAFDIRHAETSVQAQKTRKQMPSKGKKGGPRAVEYMCALCNECYTSTCDDNPWWALAQHECAKCCKMQIPRIDISSPSNAIEYHPALLAHAEENSGNGVGSSPAVAPAGSGESQNVPSQLKTPPFYLPATSTVKFSDDCDSLGSDISDGDFDAVSLSDDDESDSSGESTGDALAMSPSEQAESERFGFEYGGPVLTDDQASRLLILMAHASTCPCRHKSPKHDDACRSAKWMMLHVRDCPGTTATFDICPFPWCRKVKHMMLHLVSCTNAKECVICAPSQVASNWSMLHNLNEYRLGNASRTRSMSEKTAAAPLTDSPPVFVATEESVVASVQPNQAIQCREPIDLLPASFDADPTLSAEKVVEMRADGPSFYEESRSNGQSSVESEAEDVEANFLDSKTIPCDTAVESECISAVALASDQHRQLLGVSTDSLPSVPAIGDSLGDFERIPTIGAVEATPHPTREEKEGSATAGPTPAALGKLGQVTN